MGLDRRKSVPSKTQSQRQSREGGGGLGGCGGGGGGGGRRPCKITKL